MFQLRLWASRYVLLSIISYLIRITDLLTLCVDFPSLDGFGHPLWTSLDSCKPLPFVSYARCVRGIVVSDYFYCALYILSLPIGIPWLSLVVSFCFLPGLDYFCFVTLGELSTFLFVIALTLVLCGGINLLILLLTTSSPRRITQLKFPQITPICFVHPLACSPNTRSTVPVL